MEQRSPKRNPKQQKKDFFSAPGKWMKSVLSGNKDEDKVQLTNQSSEEFQMQVRRAIQENNSRMLHNPQVDERNMYLSTSNIFQEVIQRVMKAMQGVKNNDVQQIRTELIQKVVGLVNSLMIDIKNELNPFCLEISRHLKSSMHTCAIIVLTKYYYDEQMNHFYENLDELKKKKDELRKYFIQITASDSSADENYALNLGQQMKDHVIKEFQRNAEKDH